MKRLFAVLCAALLLAALATGCGKKDPAAVELPDPSDDYGWMTQATTTAAETEEAEEATGEEESLPEGAYTSTAYVTVPPTTKTGETTSKLPVLSGSAAAATTTRAPGTNTTTTTTKGPGTSTAATTTTKGGATAYFPGGINITSKDEALSRFNAAVKKALDSRAGFNKSHMITPQAWVFDQSLLGDTPYGPLASSILSSALNEALVGKGVHSATCSKGQSTNLMRNSQFAMGDLKDVTYTGSQGREWTVTVTVKDGQTRQEKRLFGSGISGNSPIDKGPLHMAAGDGSIYDHMSADRVFSLVKSGLSFINADPIDISESTSQVKFVAKIDGEGKLVHLQATYNQTINLKEIRILNGLNSYKDNTGSSTVTVTYDGFVY